MRFIIILFLSITSIKAQNVLILDSVTSTPIENVNLINQFTGVSSDLTGSANLTEFNNTDIITIKHISYHKKKMIKSAIGKVIFLSPKIRILPTIVFKENPKTYSFYDYLMVKKLTQRASASKSTTELLQGAAGITIQESQSGGGSPNFRGMEANRLLLVVDGLSLNNTIYRSGHLQNASTINPFFIQSFSLATGPASISFGDGALGSALLFNTISPVFLKENTNFFHQQYESSSSAVTLNYKSNYSTDHFAFVSGLSIKSIGNLTMGSKREHNYLDWGNESVISKGTEQLYTNYSQADFIHKTLFKINAASNILLNTQYSTSSKINRFDKLNDMVGTKQKYSDWYYGPQNRFLQIIKLNSTRPNLFYNTLQTVFAFQNVSESRHHKKEIDNFISNRYENVDIYDASINLSKLVMSSQFSYGLGGRKQVVHSSANIETESGDYLYNTTRYPDGGSDVDDFFIYSQISIPIYEKLKVYLGGRLNYTELNAIFTDTQTYSFPFSEIKIKNHSLVSSALLNYKIASDFTLTASIYTGFRNPNLDDVGKVFSKNDTYVVVPNSNLSPEKSKNIEFGVKGTLINNLKLNVQLFNTVITNAISRENGVLNGQDSILYDGEMMKVQMNKNIESANVSGFNIECAYTLKKNLIINSNCNYIVGKTINNLPLAHIPPLNASLSIDYTINNNNITLTTLYNSWKKAEDYDLAGVDNLEEATIDGTPSWCVLNLYYSYKLDNNFTYGIGVKNIFNIHYKTFGSGLSSSGRNFILSLHTNF